MPQPCTAACLASAEDEVDAEFVLAAGLEEMVEVELLSEGISIDEMIGVYEVARV